VRHWDFNRFLGTGFSVLSMIESVLDRRRGDDDDGDTDGGDSDDHNVMMAIVMKTTMMMMMTASVLLCRVFKGCDYSSC